MSHTELHTGKLRQIDLLGKTAEEWAKEKCIELQNGNDELQEYDTYLQDLLCYHAWNHSELEERFFHSKGRIFEIFEHVEHDDCYGIYELYPDGNGNYNFIMSFSNGETCLAECIEEELTNI